MPDRLFRSTRGEERFLELADGRTLLLPHGPGGRAFIVPNEAARERLTRRFTIADYVVRAAAAGLVPALAFRLWTAAGVLMAIAIALPVWMGRAIAESLPEARDPDALRELARRAPPRFGSTLVTIVFALAWLGFLAHQFWRSGELAGDLVLSAAAAVVVLVSGFQVWRDESADDLMWTGHTQPDNRPTNPKYF